MRRLSLSVTALAVLVLGMTACSATPEPDWSSLQSEADAFLETSDADDDLGGGTLRLSPEDAGTDQNASVTLEYAAAAQVDGISVACFGDGSIRFGFMAESGSLHAGIDAFEVRCDGAAVEVPLDEPLDDVTAITLSGIFDTGSGAVLAANVYGSPA